MYTATCRRSCIFKGKYWEVGEVYNGKEKPPHHFEITSEGEKKGKAAA